VYRVRRGRRERSALRRGGRGVVRGGEMETGEGLGERAGFRIVDGGGDGEGYGEGEGAGSE